MEKPDNSEPSAATDGSTDFTPGPWRMFHTPGDAWEVVTHDMQTTIAVSVSTHGDAQLIAMAPEMRELLREIWATIPGMELPHAADREAINNLWNRVSAMVSKLP